MSVLDRYTKHPKWKAWHAENGARFVGSGHFSAETCALMEFSSMVDRGQLDTSPSPQPAPAPAPKPRKPRQRSATSPKLTKEQWAKLRKDQDDLLRGMWKLKWEGLFGDPDSGPKSEAVLKRHDEITSVASGSPFSKESTLLIECVVNYVSQYVDSLAELLRERLAGIEADLAYLKERGPDAGEPADFAETLAKIEGDIAELKQRGSLVYRGVWDAGEHYQPGDFATHQGSMWHCNHSNAGLTPGSNRDHWTLAVKRGRSARQSEEVDR